MYESLIDIIYNDIQYKVVEELEENAVSVVQSYGINVNKEELLKALQYDRQQYEKGYADAKAEQLWVPCSEQLPEEDGLYYVTVKYKRKKDAVACIWSNGNGWLINGDVLAWIKLPEPWKGEQP